MLEQCPERRRVRVRIPRLELRQRRGDIRFAVVVVRLKRGKTACTTGAKRASTAARASLLLSQPRRTRSAASAWAIAVGSSSAGPTASAMACIRLRRRNANARRCSRSAIRAATSRRNMASATSASRATA